MIIRPILQQTRPVLFCNTIWGQIEGIPRPVTEPI